MTMRNRLFVAMIVTLMGLQISVESAAETRPISTTRGETTFQIGGDAARVNVWGRGRELPHVYFDEYLPALFERTLVLEKLDLGGGALEWLFTGEHGGFTVRIEPGAVIVTQRFYDSFGFNRIEDGRVVAGRHPERAWRESRAALEKSPRRVTVQFDYRLQLIVSIDGEETISQTCLFDVSRHQLRLTGEKGVVRGRVEGPAPRRCTVKIDPERTHQTMLGFGGIGTPAAYAQLSREGKRRWWEMVCEYNLLVQREYPIGQRLNREMSNWDALADATPHYYGDNFPNGEISNFDYIRTLRGLGGMVLFEFWELPPWAKQDWKDDAGKVHRGVANPDVYATAMVDYCRTSEEKAGAPPDIVGVQNERNQPPAIWHAMVAELRAALDAAGFESVEIHMSDSGSLSGGIDRARAFRQSDAAWSTIDYAATHMYDYQGFFTNPDGYDARLAEWKKLTGDKPFLSTELCVNSSNYQWPTYRLAFQMGQLYHKNLVQADASAVLYCWTLLNVVQPSYGWTRSLCVPDREHGFVPAASSRQLRVYGAYSRRLKNGMVRIEATTDDAGLLVSAFAGEGGRQTIVLMNRSFAPCEVKIESAAPFAEMEIVDLYRENKVREAPATDDEGLTAITIEPGAVVTLTNVPLGRLPDRFEPAE